MSPSRRCAVSHRLANFSNPAQDFHVETRVYGGARGHSGASDGRILAADCRHNTLGGYATTTSAARAPE